MRRSEAKPSRAAVEAAAVNSERVPVIFDLDGVLVDSEPLYREAFEAYVAAARRPEMRGWFVNTLGRRQADFALELAGLLDRPLAEVTAGLDGELARALDRAALEAMPGAAAAVLRLRSERRALGLASSSARPFVDRALAAIGLEEAFDALATGDEVRRGKPDPEIYLTAAGRLRVEPRECVAVEDTPAGVAAAQAAGMTVIAVPNALTAGLGFPGADSVQPDLERAVAAITELDR